MGADEEKDGAEGVRKLRHDIKNQLSNIHLALEQLRYEIPNPTSDCLFYMDTIEISSIRINTLLNDSN
jgi:nitrogen fixation/metabolism regulation signal transduction histidine kinase